ncbi:unnamed protein product [Rangifer tarandus platyrhynchus]|uniref:Uncharacterized protein n=1 Tax=Rangifer tarandus platyrhynchus TaxID=3082113 RepID=A0AC59Y776_RANTA
MSGPLTSSTRHQRGTGQGGPPHLTGRPPTPPRSTTAHTLQARLFTFSTPSWAQPSTSPPEPGGQRRGFPGGGRPLPRPAAAAAAPAV